MKEVSRAMASEYFVAPNGTGDGSINTPFGTLDEALGAQSSDTITFRSGYLQSSIFPQR